MPAWLPILKAVLPYVSQIVATAIPAFTSKPLASKVDEIVAGQIAELQSAVTRNSESIHVLAEKLQETLQGIDGAANTLQRELQFLKRLVIAACSLSVAALLLAGWALLR